MAEAALLLTALLFGGMILYSFGFAAFLFSALPATTAGPVIRQAFPHFYMFVAATAALAALLVAAQDMTSAILLGLIGVTVIPTRQLLMPAINHATDTGNKTRFHWLHGASVLITLAHIAMAGVALARFL